MNTVETNQATAPPTQESKITKIQTLANALLDGEHVTGLQMIIDYRIASYRDSVLLLRKRGMDITTIMDKHNDGLHGRYFMTQEAINAYNERLEGIA